MKDQRLSTERVRHLAEVVQLDLSDERVDRLSQMLSDFVAGFEKVRDIDTDAYDPPTLTFDDEVTR